MKRYFITYKNSQISYKTAGSGSKLLFCFHGFAEDGFSFSVFEHYLGRQYTLIAPDFPFHGETTWNDGLLLQPDAFLEILSTIVSDCCGDRLAMDRFSILAYSMGGRIAFHLMQMMPRQIERVVLAAPDGLTLNFWYWLGTQTKAGNILFKYTMKHPGWFFFLVNQGGKSGLFNKSITKFVHHYIDDEKARMQLYQRWTTMRKFKPDFKKIIPLLKEHPIRLTLVYGSYDRIIVSKRSDFLTASDKRIKVKILQAGHQLLREKHAKEIASAFSE